jgi:predicted nucleotidyltransferase component of viral defense system
VIAERDQEQQLVFKGGTSLRLCHFTDYRYSADPDLSSTGGVDAATRCCRTGADVRAR